MHHHISNLTRTISSKKLGWRSATAGDRARPRAIGIARVFLGMVSVSHKYKVPVVIVVAVCSRLKRGRWSLAPGG